MAVLLDKETLLSSSFERIDLAQQWIGRTVQTINFSLEGPGTFDGRK
jgi:hypothetical protein